MSEIKEIAEELQKATAGLREELKKRDADIDRLGKESAESKAALAKANEHNDALEDKMEEHRKSIAEMEAKQAALETVLGRFGGNRDNACASAAEYRKGINAILTGDEAFNPREFDVKALGASVPLYAKGTDGGMALNLDLKLLSTDNAQEGGYAVSTDKTGPMVRTEFLTSPMRALATVRPTSKPFIEGPYTDNLPPIANVGEQSGAWTEDGNAYLDNYKIGTHIYKSTQKATEWMLQDADWDVVGWLMEAADEAMTIDQNTDFIVGNGRTGARGILTYADGTTRGTIGRLTTQVATFVDFQTLNAITEELKDKYHGQDAAFLCHRLSRAVLRNLTDDQNRPLWQPSQQDGTPPRWGGFSVFGAEDMPQPTNSVTGVYTTGDLPFAFGNFRRGYMVADRSTMQVKVDSTSQFPDSLYHAYTRVGGDVVNFEAIKLIEIA